MEVALDLVEGGVPGGVCGEGDLGLLAAETSCRSILNMSVGKMLGLTSKELEVGRDKDLVTLDLILMSASLSFNGSNSRFARDSKQ